MVGFESVKKWRKMFFVLSRALDKQKYFLSPLEKSNRRPLDSVLRCSTTEPQRFYSERGLLRRCVIHDMCLVMLVTRRKTSSSEIKPFPKIS